MTYTVIADPALKKRLRRLFKKDRKAYEFIKKKSRILSTNPDLGKPLRNVMKNKRRIHIGSFILIYRIDEKNKVINLLEFEHHDKAYK